MAGHRRWEEVRAEFLARKSSIEAAHHQGWAEGMREMYEEMQPYYDQLLAAGQHVLEALHYTREVANMEGDAVIQAAIDRWLDPHADR